MILWLMLLKHRWSIQHNFLTGLTAGAWWELLRDNRFAVDPAYWHRAALVTLTSFINSFYRAREERLYGSKVAATEVSAPPIFILGHWRSGTTHLHNLLARDTENFAFPNTYQVVNPHTFLVSEEVNSARFERFVPKTRPMDNMALSFDAPQEDEFAPCLATGYSPYLGIVFPRREDHYERYLTFRDVPAAEIDAWKSALHRFVQKLTLKYQRPLLLKSPGHTARIALLLEIFPDARFVHLHRHPYDVFQSQLHYYDTAVWYSYLQKPDRSRVVDTILNRYRELHRAFFEQRDLIPPGHFHELRFEDLERDPLGETAKIYNALSLGDFSSARPELEKYLATLETYRKNTYGGLSPEDRATVARRWSDSFDAWGYAK